MTTSYCTACGAENVQEVAGTYDEIGGQPVVRKVCSVDPCKHNGCSGYRITDKAWWQNLLGLGGDWKCSRCGKVYYSGPS